MCAGIHVVNKKGEAFNLVIYQSKCVSSNIKKIFIITVAILLKCKLLFLFVEKKEAICPYNLIFYTAYNLKSKHMIYRDRIDIMSQILEAVNGSSFTKTKIMYKAVLSYNQLKEYLPLLTEKDLIRYDENTQTFRTTGKGLRFLDIYNRIGDMIKEGQPQPQQQQQPQQQMWIQRGE
jgi:predicted transcriptional regulator